MGILNGDINTNYNQYDSLVSESDFPVTELTPDLLNSKYFAVCDFTQHAKDWYAHDPGSMRVSLDQRQTLYR